MCMQAVGRMQNPSLEIFQKFDTDASGSLSPKEWMVVSIWHLRRCISYLGWGISHLGWGISYLGWGISHLGWGISYFRRCISYLGWGISYFGWGISYFGRCIWCLGCCILHCSGSLSPMEWIAVHHYESSISNMCSSWDNFLWNFCCFPSFCESLLYVCPPQDSKRIHIGHICLGLFNCIGICPVLQMNCILLHFY